MTRATVLSLVLAGFAATHAVGQNPPDFSGEWRPIGSDAAPTPPGGGGPPPPPRTLSITITQTSDEMKVARRVESGGREAIYHFGYRFDGSATVNQMGPIVFHTRASREGTTLLLASDVSVEDKQIGTLREVYSLDDGKLTVESIRTGPAGTMKDRAVHEKVVRP